MQSDKSNFYITLYYVVYIRFPFPDNFKTYIKPQDVTDYASTVSVKRISITTTNFN